MIIEPGNPLPFGASLIEGGVNFALYSKEATHVTLCLFEKDECIHEISLDPEKNKTGLVWHVAVKNLPLKIGYAYKLSKQKGKLFSKYFNPQTLVLDPYALAVNTSHEWGKSDFYQPLGLVLNKTDFDWEEDRPLNIPLIDLIPYEMHVRGFTQKSNVKNPGTFLGVIEKIPYLKDLGINALKMMPIHEFNECEYQRFNPFTGARLYNYWGYSSINFFSPMNRYAISDSIQEFKTMVKALHKAGIEVILDVVFNHTGEGDEMSPIYSYRGLSPSVYYMLDQNHNFYNFTGCGNTVNCNHPIVREMIKSCLQYWVTEMHVDGFRFDLAAIMTRGVHGEPLTNPPLIEELSHDPVLSKTKLIAEPWDIGGLYKLGSFFPEEERWSEWNDRYRDSVRRFFKGDHGEKREFAARLCGSEDIFGSSRTPASSINFITAHDGFTLRDLVSYNQKQNLGNGEDNRDGNSHNISWNCGVEGETDDENIIHLRERQMKNFHLALMISQGVPMVMMGNEYRHTRFGNNNSWCQDNDLNWFLWDELNKDQPFYRFYRGLIHFRNHHAILRKGHFLREEDIDWHGVHPFNPDWDGASRELAFTLKSEGYYLYAAFNPSENQTTFELPEGHTWKMIANTANLAPHDFYEETDAPTLNKIITLQNHSSILLKSSRGNM